MCGLLSDVPCVAVALRRPDGDSGVLYAGGVYWNRSQSLRWDRKAAVWVDERPPSCVQKAGTTVQDFTSAFREPAFRWLWIQTFVATIGGTFTSYFFYCELAATNDLGRRAPRCTFGVESSRVLRRGLPPGRSTVGHCRLDAGLLYR